MVRNVLKKTRGAVLGDRTWEGVTLEEAALT